MDQDFSRIDTFFDAMEEKMPRKKTSKTDPPADLDATKVVKPRKKKSKPAKPEPPQTRIYIGPSLPEGGLMQFTAFKGALPANVREQIKKHPEINRLLVPASDLAAARIRLKSGRGVEAGAWKRMARKLNT